MSQATTSGRSLSERGRALRWPAAIWRIARGAAPAAAVLCALGGLAFWGHSTDWTLPKFSVLMGGRAGPAEDWCPDHNVEESKCIECNVTLAPPEKDHGWCREHGVAQCPLHHPDVAQLKGAPSISEADFERAARALSLRPRAENNSRCKMHLRRIQFASDEALQKVGLEVAATRQRRVVEAVVANGEVTYDQTHTAHLASRTPGTVWRVEAQTGDEVRRGDILALIDAADVGRAKSELLHAIAQTRLKQTILDRLQPLSQDGTVAVRQVREAEAALQESQIRLLGAQQTLVNLGLPVRVRDFSELSTDEIAERIQFLGIPSELAARLEGSTTTSNLYPLRAPLDGIVVDHHLVAGEVVDAGSMLFGVANLQKMWLTLNVRQEDARYLKLDQVVRFRPSDRHDDPEIEGAVDWISTSADVQTRTVKVRAVLPNRERLLRANTFGTGRIVLRDEPSAVVVPADAVHWDGCCNVVFVRDKDFLKAGGPKFFHVRKVRLGVRGPEGDEIIAGLLPGEVIATANSVVLEAQLLKSNLGAGCCAAH